MMTSPISSLERSRCGCLPWCQHEMQPNHNQACMELRSWLILTLAEICPSSHGEDCFPRQRHYWCYRRACLTRRSAGLMQPVRNWTLCWSGGENGAWLMKKTPAFAKSDGASRGQCSRRWKSRMLKLHYPAVTSPLSRPVWKR